MCLMICVTCYLSVRYICKACMAVEAMHRGLITIKK